MRLLLKKYKNTSTFQQGFTIVELLIVIVVIAILAAITIVSYNGISSRAKASSAQLSAKQGYTKVTSYAIQNSDAYPPDLTTAGLSNASGTLYEYSVDNTANPHTFCLTATVSGVSYNVSSTSSVPSSGLCPGHTGGVGIADGATIQTVTSANCPATRTRVVDGRDNNTYWVQKLADGKCWMLTNLAYAGGGTNTYSDTKTLVNGTGGSTTSTVAQYYIPANANVTTTPTAPSTSTDGGATNPQYGYLYNWCGAMGGQSTAACSGSAVTPTPDTTTSVCPAGWRLATGNGGEFAALNSAVNSNSTSSDAGLRSAWLGQWAGFWSTSFNNAGTYGYYWSSTLSSSSGAYGMITYSTGVGTAMVYNKSNGLSVRCVAN